MTLSIPGKPDCASSGVAGDTGESAISSTGARIVLTLEVIGQSTDRVAQSIEGPKR